MRKKHEKEQPHYFFILSLTRHVVGTRENSSSPETCNDGVCSTTSPEEMTSVRTCYCKHEKNVTRKKANDIRIHNGNRHPTIVSKKSIATNTTCGSDRESCKRSRHVINEKTSNANRSVEVQPSNPILSPETSTALENAEKIINNAKIQLMEVCATSSFDSARRNRNTYSDEPPLDDEMEERLYVRELVASKFHDACSSRLSEANGKASARSEKRDSPRVTVRKVDLSAPKFRVSRRRRADWSSLGYGSDNRERASPARVPSKDSIRNVNKTIARDDRARDRRRMLSAQGNACEIQIGPSVHIVDQELTRQDLEDVHISPESSRAQNHANTATYILCHDVLHTNADNGTNDSEVSLRTQRMRLDTLQRGKPIEKPIIEATTEAAPVTPAGKLEKEFEDVKNSGRDVERLESPKVRNYRQEKKDPEGMPQNAEGISESLKDTNRGAAKFAVIETSRIDRNKKLHKAERENHEGILFSSASDTQIRYAKDDGIFCNRSADRQRNVENTVDKIQAKENRSDRSKPDDDTSRIAGFPRQRENIASRCRKAENPKPHRTIDRHFSHTFNNHNGRNGLYDVGEEVQRRSIASGDVFRETIFAEDNLDEIDLYRPSLDDLDSILHSNDRKIERVARVIRNLSELLSGPKFAIYKLDEDERESQNAKKFCRNSLNDKNGYEGCLLDEANQSSILETELRNEDLTVSENQHRTDEDLQAANATETKSSAFAQGGRFLKEEDGSRSNYSKNSVESIVFPASDASDSDKTQQSAAKACLLELSMDRSDATTFSNLAPALSSTHTEQACHQKKEIARGDRHRVASARKFSEREIRRSRKEYTDDGIFARLFQKDTSQADRFVAYILQDEKRSIEGKLASALKESAVTPAAVQKLLDYLREAESIRDARQTAETLDILRNILINVKGQPDQGNANDKETSFRNVPDFSARTNVPPNAIDQSREQSAQRTPAKVNANEIERNFAKNSDELKDALDEHSSECRETRESIRSTARCESMQHFETNSKKDVVQTEKNTDVVRTISIDVKNQKTDKDVNENNSKKGETSPRNVTGFLIRTNATSNVMEEATLQTRAENNTNDNGQVTGKSNDSRNPDKYLSLAIPKSRESVHSAAHFEVARGSKNNSENNSKGNSCSEAESLKQISDIRSDDDNENLEENCENLSAKIASARSKGESEMETVDFAAVVVSENKDDRNIEKLGGDKSREVNKNQRANKIVTQTDQVIDVRSNVPQEAIKEIASEKTRDSITPAFKKVLFTFAEASEIKNERIRSDASPAKSKLIDEDLTKGDVGLVHSSAKEDTGSLREAKIDPQQEMIKEKISSIIISDNNSSAEFPRDCVLSKNSELFFREVASCDKQISFDIAGKDNSTRDMRNEEVCKSMTFAAVENRRDGNEISEPQKTARNDNDERQLIDLTDTSRKYKIDVLSSSNSSVSSTLLDYGRSTNDASSADARRVGTTPETSHSEGELYMPSSCSYSLGEVRVLRRKRDLIENNAIDRDSSVTILVTRSMLTSLNDSTMSLLGSSEH